MALINYPYHRVGTVSVRVWPTKIDEKKTVVDERGRGVGQYHYRNWRWQFAIAGKTHTSRRHFKSSALAVAAARNEISKLSPGLL